MQETHRAMSESGIGGTWARLGKACLGVAAAWALACGNGRIERSPPRHVFLITVDTLRADHLGSHGYARRTSPRLDALAASGVVFERGIAQWPKTGPSFASVFTGRYPQTTGLTHSAWVRLPGTSLTLPEFFRRNGFRTLAVVSNPVLSRRLGWARGFTEFKALWGDEAPEEAEALRRLICAPQVTRAARALLDKHAGAERLFVWLHYSDPHAPYLLPEGVENPFLADRWSRGGGRVKPETIRGRAIPGHTDVGHYVAQYDANILLVDVAIQEVLDHARGLGLLDNALVLFTADHGESLGEHGLYFEHGPLPYNTTLHVPLFFVFVPQASEAGGPRVALPVELVDLFPTLRDLIAPGMQIEGLEGRSLTPLLSGEEGEREGGVRYAFSGAGRRQPHLTHFRIVQDATWKLVYHPQMEDGPRSRESYELYQLAADPREERNVAAQYPEERHRLESVLFEWMASRPGFEAKPPQTTAEIDRALKALGYVE